ncbi:MAG: hypothetical protein PHX62_09510 [Bacilli bacterium]|nr:hypothetical protein [Bacilli bacterium]
MKAKKKLTSTQKKNRYRVAQYSTFAGEFVSVLSPYIILGAINADEWFTTENGWKVGLGGALTLALMGIATFLVTKKKEQESELTNGWITMMVGWFTIAFIFLLLGNIIDQIASIMLWGGLGIIGAFGLDITSRHFKKKADMYKKAIEKVRGENLEETIKKEIEQEVEKEVEQETQATE